LTTVPSWFSLCGLAHAGAGRRRADLARNIRIQMWVVAKLHHAPVDLDASVHVLEVHQDRVQHESVYVRIGMLPALLARACARQKSGEFAVAGHTRRQLRRPRLSRCSPLTPAGPRLTPL